MTCGFERSAAEGFQFLWLAKFLFAEIEIADPEKVAKTENKEKKLQIFLSQYQPADLDGKKDSFDEQMSEICLQ